MNRGVNLIPIERRNARQRRRRLHRWMAATVVHAGLIFAACIGVRVATYTDSSAVAGSLVAIRQHAEEISNSLAATRKLLIEAELTRQTNQTITDQPDWSILLSLLGGTVGDDVVLRQVQLRPDPVNRRQFILSFNGISKTQPGVSQFLLRLQTLDLFDDIKLVRTGREPVLNTTAISFDIVCRLGDKTASADSPAGSAAPGRLHP